MLTKRRERSGREAERPLPLARLRTVEDLRSTHAVGLHLHKTSGGRETQPHLYV